MDQNAKKKPACFGQKFGEAVPFFLRLFEIVGTFHGTATSELWQLDILDIQP